MKVTLLPAMAVPMFSSPLVLKVRNTDRCTHNFTGYSMMVCCKLSLKPANEDEPLRGYSHPTDHPFANYLVVFNKKLKRYNAKLTGS